MKKLFHITGISGVSLTKDISELPTSVSLFIDLEYFQIRDKNYDFAEELHKYIVRYLHKNYSFKEDTISYETSKEDKAKNKAYLTSLFSNNVSVYLNDEEFIDAMETYRIKLIFDAAPISSFWKDEDITSFSLAYLFFKNILTPMRSNILHSLDFDSGTVTTVIADFNNFYINSNIYEGISHDILDDHLSKDFSSIYKNFPFQKKALETFWIYNKEQIVINKKYFPFSQSYQFDNNNIKVEDFLSLLKSRVTAYATTPKEVDLITKEFLVLEELKKSFPDREMKILITGLKQENLFEGDYKKKEIIYSYLHLEFLKFLHSSESLLNEFGISFNKFITNEKEGFAILNIKEFSVDFMNPFILELFSTYLSYKDNSDNNVNFKDLFETDFYDFIGMLVKAKKEQYSEITLYTSD